MRSPIPRCDNDARRHRISTAGARNADRSRAWMMLRRARVDGNRLRRRPSRSKGPRAPRSKPNSGGSHGRHTRRPCSTPQRRCRPRHRLVDRSLGAVRQERRHVDRAGAGLPRHLHRAQRHTAAGLDCRIAVDAGVRGWLDARRAQGRGRRQARSGRPVCRLPGQTHAAAGAGRAAAGGVAGDFLRRRRARFRRGDGPAWPSVDLSRVQAA